ncbi:MAG: hypothetical protein K0B15_15995 [Lentimicrobium sp.]|nr:hypothetical protein [Lentimicrobium sp.]
MDQVNAINDRIVTLKARFESQQGDAPQTVDKDASEVNDQEPDSKGRLIIDATACPQDIAYPTDLDLLSGAREKTEQLIDKLYHPLLHKQKPRTYRQVARKRYLQTTQKLNSRS